MIGASIGPYRIDGILGSGGTAVVYAAEHRRHARQVAIKMMRPVSEGERAEPLAARFLSELDLLRTLAGCPYVVQLHDWGFVDQRHPYYVMDFVEGETLERVLRWRGSYTPTEAFAFLQQLCIALQAIHARGVLHLDLKPANILLRQHLLPRVVLLDFGLASRVDDGPRPTNRAAGTPLFAAPEQAMSRPDLFCPATDIYALGVLTYVLLTEREPFDLTADDDVRSVFTLRLRCDPVPLSARLQTIEPALAALVDSCLDLDPRRRPSSANAFIGRYAEALGVDPVAGLSCGGCEQRQTCTMVPPPVHVPLAATRATAGRPPDKTGTSPTAGRTAKDPAAYATTLETDRATTAGIEARTDGKDEGPATGSNGLGPRW